MSNFSSIDISFKDWMTPLFNHNYIGTWSENVQKVKADIWSAKLNPSLAIKHTTTLFSKAGSFLAEYSNNQIAIGLWILADSVISDYNIIPKYKDDKNLIDDRVSCILSMSNLYEEIFSSRCSNYLTHLEDSQNLREDYNPLNTTCYMWWDLLGGYVVPTYYEIDKASLNVLERTLRFKSICCSESALHGLGHWYQRYSRTVKKTIQKFLFLNTDISPDLRKYALDAKKGNVR